MAIEKITDHAEQAVNRLLQQYRGRPRMEGLIRSAGASVQRLENAILPVQEGRWLFGGRAVGRQLDLIGEYVGVKRNGAPDPLYLVLILGSIGRNNTDSTAPRVLDVLRTVYQADAVYMKMPNAPSEAKVRDPATVSISVAGPKTPTDYFSICQGIVQDSLAAGVSIAYVSYFNLPKAFSMAGPQTWVGGFSDLSGNGGGRMASLSYTNRGQ